jgi:predicted Zn-dependent protease
MTDSRQVPISEAMALALEHHRAGRFDVAEAVYRAVLESEPSHAGARYNLALLALQSGRPLDALPALGDALREVPQNAAHWLNYATALAGGGDPLAARDLLLDARQRGFRGPLLDETLAQVQRMIDAPPPTHVESIIEGEEPPPAGR